MKELNREFETLENVNKVPNTLLENLKNKPGFQVIDELYLPPINDGDSELVVPRYWTTVEEVSAIFEKIIPKNKSEN